MYHVSAQGVDERMINVHYYYYYPGDFIFCRLSYFAHMPHVNTESYGEHSFSYVALEVKSNQYTLVILHGAIQLTTKVY